MSDYIPKTTRKQNLQYVNCYTSIHDLGCNCDEPLKHIIKQITEQEPSIKPWLATTFGNTGDQDGEKDIDGFAPGELERLFAEGEDAKDG